MAPRPWAARTRPTGQAGQAIVVVAAMMAALLGFVGLAIDTARILDGRRVLQDSVDAASLAAAESFQAGKGWTVSQTNAVSLFEVDNRLAPGESCSPAFAAPQPGTPLTVNCSTTSGYSLALTAADNGPAGQTFTLRAGRTISAVLLQALGQFTAIQIQATATATASDLALTPALGGLASNNCYGAVGIDPIQLSGSPTIVGDVVSNGSFAVPATSTPQVAGNVLTRCGPPANAGNIAYRCWRSGASPPCPATDTLGRLLSTSSRLADLHYTAPASAAQAGLPSANQIVWNPATYTADPQFGSVGARCYFLTPGVYEWQGGLTVNAGIVSNQLRPPGEPVPGSPTTRGIQFWDANGAKCGGTFTPTAVSSGGITGTYSIEVTAVRTETAGAVTYTRESAPSFCQTVTLSTAKLSVLISNVPGATSYNLYTTAAGGSCSGPFHQFANLAANTGAPGGAESQQNDTTGSCPATNTPTTCSLGTSTGVYDSATFPSTGAAPPDAEVASFAPGLPYQSASRAQPRSGDLANENSCADGTGTAALCPAAVTPGAVVMKLTGANCINVRSGGGDLHLFSGYQYNWVLVHEPPTTTCSNSWGGKTNSALLGLAYSPSASFNLDSPAALEAPTGGVVAATIAVTNGTTITFNPAYAPRPPATRLTT